MASGLIYPLLLVFVTGIQCTRFGKIPPWSVKTNLVCSGQLAIDAPNIEIVITVHCKKPTLVIYSLVNFIDPTPMAWICKKREKIHLVKLL